MKATPEIVEHWQQQIQGYKQSGMSRKAYCQKHQIPIHRFDYWQRKVKKEAVQSLAKKKGNWIPLQVCEEKISGEQRIHLRIGRVAIEIESGFDRRLLAEVLGVVGAVC